MKWKNRIDVLEKYLNIEEKELIENLKTKYYADKTMEWQLIDAVDYLWKKYPWKLRKRR